jgi:hypothetical protein
MPMTGRQLVVPPPPPLPRDDGVCVWHSGSRGRGGTVAGGGTILEYGASAVFPCGVIPATDPQGRVPALGRLTNYGSRVI